MNVCLYLGLSFEKPFLEQVCFGREEVATESPETNYLHFMTLVMMKTTMTMLMMTTTMMMTTMMMQKKKMMMMMVMMTMMTMVMMTMMTMVSRHRHTPLCQPSLLSSLIPRRKTEILKIEKKQALCAGSF